jgi:hypothetical protein
LKVYYDKLSCKIKVNNVLSKLIKLARGVKLGGILSGDLFNFFIDDLIHECCNAGVGVFFIDIIIAILCFCDDVCLLSPNEHDMQILLNICDNYSKKWGLEYNTAKCKFIVFGSNKLNNTNFILNNLSLSYCNNIKYLGVEFYNNLNFNDFFFKKILSVSNSFFSLNSFGFKPCGINPFLQSQVYKSFCLSRLLYSFEILSINKKTLNVMNVNQNNIIRFMTGLPKNSHISNTRRILKLLSINELNDYMKLIFIKNLKYSKICNDIFNYLLNQNYKNNTKSFIKEFKSLCTRLNLSCIEVFENINEIVKKFKIDCLNVEESIEKELILTCLNNNHDYKMIDQLNLVTYSGPQYNVNNLD